MMRRGRFLLLMTSAALLPHLAVAKPAAGPRATRGAVEARLRSYEPGNASGWQALGPGADEALVQIGRDPGVEVLIRARAVSALGYFPTAPSRRFLEQTVASGANAAAAADRLLLRRAAVALGWIGGLEVPARLG